jgi:hypothetical protein
VNWFTGAIRLASWIACLIVATSFVLFATHQADDGTGNEIAALGNNAVQVQNAKDKPSSIRTAITNASNTLTSPFSNVLNSNKAWPVHLSQLVIALLLYGFGVGFLLRWIRMRN